MSARTAFLDAIEPVLDGLGIILNRANRASIGQVQKLTAVAGTATYQRTPAAPYTNITWNGTLTLVSPHLNPEMAENELERIYEQLTSVRSSQFILQDATLAEWTDKQYCLDIAVMAIFQKE